MTLRQLRYFMILAETNHFGNAASRLCITQSALTQQLKKLEESLDSTLFIRDSKNIKITKAGKKLLKYAVLIDKYTTEATSKIGQINSHDETPFSLGIVDSLPTDLLTEFFNKSPDILTQLNITSISFSEIIQKLQDNIIDSAFTYTLGNHPQRIYQREVLNGHLQLISSKHHTTDVHKLNGWSKLVLHSDFKHLIGLIGLDKIVPYNQLSCSVVNDYKLVSMLLDQPGCLTIAPSFLAYRIFDSNDFVFSDLTDFTNVSLSFLWTDKSLPEPILDGLYEPALPMNWY